eukprot:TRINITY_DN348_c0_g3_i2.p1 TRINITY_DN348_c0_g3~~TRINITY_DN348_c0_g3_i2.p1  ORF type:complete len:517 (-),score=133.79 TRINITY_DN348_c0_g3_i2:86-1636(-)
MSMKTLLLLNCPRTQKALTVAETSTVKDFRAAVAKAFDVNVSKLESCALVCAKYGKAPYSLDLNAMEEEETKLLAKKEKVKVMKDFLMDGCVLSFQYPVSYARRKKEEKSEESKEESASDDDDAVRFKGLTKATILSLLMKNEKAIIAAAAVESGKKKSKTNKKSRPENMLDFFDIHSRSLFKKIENDKSWTKISPALLRTLLSRDTLSASEIYIMKALLIWGEAHLSKPKESSKSSSDNNNNNDDDDDDEEVESKEDEDPSTIDLPEVTDELKKVVSDYVKYIRFPTMPMTLIAGCVTSSNLLSQQQLLDLFQYCSMRPKDEDESSKKTKAVSLPSSLSCFSVKKRVPTESSSDWKFDSTINSTYYTATDNGKTLTVISNGSDWKTVPTTKWIKSGITKIKFKIEKFISGSYWEIGLVYRSFSNYEYYLGQNNQAVSWQSDSSSSSVIYYNGSSTTYGKSYKAGDIVEMIIDMNKHELRFNLNGVSQGSARTDLPSEVCPAVCSYVTSGGIIKIM